MIGVAFDNASVNTGTVGGLRVQLKNDIPGLFVLVVPATQWQCVQAMQ